MIKLSKVNKYYNRYKKNEIHVINNVSLDLEDKGLVALLGPSGSGKTTILNAIGGLDKIKSGKIVIDNQKITSKRAGSVDKIRNLNIGYIFQDYKLLENMSVYDNISLVLKMIGIKDKKEIKTRVDYVLEKVGMYRYRNRPAGMLSGGERQRVGIARAIVKNPNIIIADEPTGNLDSKNSLEIMNIIKAISKQKLVILVTHERDLAKFYASRIIELQDGSVKKDYINNHKDELDYQIENKIYLKDMKNHHIIKDEKVDIDFYTDKPENIKLNIVLKNGNIYIQATSKEKLEIVDEDSSVEFINEHYKKIDQSTIEKYQFDFEKVINKDIKKKYSSILNPITTITSGIRKVFEFSILKKILLLGFFVSAMFIMYAVSTISATLKIEDKDFIKYNKDYLNISIGKININDYLEYEKNENIHYLLPGDSNINLKMKYDDFYQTSVIEDMLEGSLSALEMVSEKQLVCGKMPESPYEIIVDKMVIDKILNSSWGYAKMAGILTVEDFLDKEAFATDNTHLKPFKIVGMVDLQSPSIYINKSNFINLLDGTQTQANTGGSYVYYIEGPNQPQEDTLMDYTLIEDEIKLIKGRMPQNDYEVIVNNSHRYDMPLNKEINIKVNEKKLKVVGYYDSKNNYDYYLVNNNTIKYRLITQKEEFVVYAKDKQIALQKFQEDTLNVKDTYEQSKNDYLKEQKEKIKGNLIFSSIILAISLIEIFLMMRSSFLSRIKEIGILRAIGVKKRDIYKMFIGETLAITTLTSLPGIFLLAYILKILSTVKYLESAFVINIFTVGITVCFVYTFNLVVGLLPVFRVIRKRPAQILSRHDLQ